MDVLEAIYNRKSVRDFIQDDFISIEIVEEIIRAGIRAPSGKNGQPWNFIVMRDEKLKKDVREFSNNRAINNSSCLLFVFLDKDRSYDTKKDTMAIGACIENILLACENYGISTCWDGDILNCGDSINKLFFIPSKYELMAMICLGLENKRVCKFQKRTKRYSIEKTIIKVF